MKRVESPELPSIDQKYETLFVRRVGFSITLGDGTTLRNADLGIGKAGRVSFAKGPLGQGADYSVHFQAKNGLSVFHQVTQFAKQPFVFVVMGVRNAGSSPIAITEIQPVVAGPGDITGWRPQTKILTRHMAIHSGYPVFGGDQPTALTMLHDPVGQFALGLGVLPWERAITACAFAFVQNGYQGEIRCSYVPPVVLRPGESLESDVVWLSYGIADPAKLESFYYWTLGNQPKPPLASSPPRVWVGAETATPLAGLIDRAAAWRRMGVAYALIPAGWAGKPGSLRGATPGYPEDMAEAMSRLSQAGLYPGITVDPLAKSLNDAKQDKSSSKKRKDKKEKKAQDSQDASPTGDGASGWINPASEDALRAVAQRIHLILEWGANFLVAAPSAIPDDALREYGLTRREANRLGLELATRAAGNIPVLPAPAATRSAEQGQWFEAARLGNEMVEYALLPAPVRINADTVANVTPETGVAMRMWPGSVELLGSPKGDAGRMLGESLGRSWLSGKALDGAGGQSLLWQVDFRDAEGRYQRGLVIALAGAGTWTTDMLKLDPGLTVAVWDPADGATIDTSEKPVPATQELRVYGLAPQQPGPAFMGTSGGLDLHMDAVKDLVWDEREGLLRGELTPPLRGAGAAYFAIPPSWAFKTGTVNGKTLKAKKIKEQLAVKVPEDSFCFNLRFKKK